MKTDKKHINDDDPFFLIGHTVCNVDEDDILYYFPNRVKEFIVWNKKGTNYKRRINQYFFVDKCTYPPFNNDRDYAHHIFRRESKIISEIYL